MEEKRRKSGLTTRLGNGIAIVFGMHASLILSNLAKNLSAFLIILLFSRVWTVNWLIVMLWRCYFRLVFEEQDVCLLKIGCGRKCYGFC